MSPSLHIHPLNTKKNEHDIKPDKVLKEQYLDCESPYWALNEFIVRANLEAVFETIEVSDEKAECVLQYGGESNSSENLYIPCKDYNDHQYTDWHDEVRKFLKEWKTKTDFQSKRDFIFDQNQNTFRFDLPGLCAGILDRWEEEIVSKRDEHDRFPAEESLLFQIGVLDRPVVDEIANCFGRIVCEQLNIELPEPKSFLALTWDIDSAGFWYPPAMASNVRRVIRDRGWGIVPELMKSAWITKSDVHQDPHMRYDYILDRLRPSSSKCTWFVQALKIHKVDNYNLRHAKRLIYCLKKVLRETHEMGTHYSYATRYYRDENKSYSRQHQIVISTLRMIGSLRSGSRAHYLRHGSRDEVLLDYYDASFGFSGSEGFRLGTAWPVRYDVKGFDDEGNEVWGFCFAVPFHFMDVTMRFHKGLSPEESLDIMKDLNRKVEKTGGIFSIIWHPNNLDPFLWSGWERLPFALLDEKPSRTYEDLLAEFK